jgi:Family of unknown function (DUF6789)
MREPSHTEQPGDVSTPGESYQGIFSRIGRSLVAGIVATGVLWVLKLTRGSIPQLDTIRFLDRVAEATSKATGLPDTLTTGWIWHWVIGTLIWATLFGIMQPILPGRTFWTKGVAFGVISGLLIMLLVMPLAGAGYFGMDLTLMDPVISLVYHIIYGVTLAGVYTLVSGRRATTD